MTCSTSRPNGSIPVFGSTLSNSLAWCTRVQIGRPRSRGAQQESAIISAMLLTNWCCGPKLRPGLLPEFPCGGESD
jgi:hypothetical protein